MLSKMPFLLVLMIISVMCLNQFIPLETQQILYSISLSIKEIIVFLLPFIIFGLLFKTSVNLSNDATRIIILILAAVCCSNFISTFISHYVGIWIYHSNLSIISPDNIKQLNESYIFKIPTIIANDKAMLLGAIFGVITARYKLATAIKIADNLEYMISLILKLFTYIIPFFVVGFVVKLQYEGVMSLIIKDYSQIFILTALAQFGYIAIIYYIMNNFKITETLHNIKNILPAALTGFTTMSSAASIPLTICGVENSTINKDLARSIVPITVNIHLIGDCFAIPIFAYAILKNYNMPEPSLLVYSIFTCYFVLAKFSVAAIPGGGIIVMLPILQKYLNFNSDMLSLITALYILFDPVITCANVFGNGAFAKTIDKIHKFFLAP